MTIQRQRTVYVEVGQPGRPGLRIEDLRIKFDIQKDDTSSPNRGNLQIWGLTTRSAEFIERPDTIVQLFAGYRELAGLVFLGDVTEARTKSTKPESITTITSGDGHKVSTASAKPVSIEGKTDLVTVLKTTLKGAIKDPLGALKGLSPKTKAQSFPRGFSASGSLVGTLNGLARARKFDWTIQDGVPVFLDKAAPLAREVVRLTPESGLVGSPERMDKGRVKITALLDPRIRPRQLVQVESEEYSGFFMVKECQYVGDSGWDAQFFVIFEAVEVVP